MKLKNKKTGEIGTLIVDGAYNFVTNFAVEDDERNRLGEYNSLAELNEEWCDYEEPKEYWYIDWNGEVCRSDIHDERTEQMKQIGNFFKTEEEAEKAEKKLRAWTRLKDKGFKFDGYDVAHKSNGNLAGQIFYDAGNYSIEDVEKEMDLIFGGEE